MRNLILLALAAALSGWGANGDEADSGAAQARATAASRESAAAAGEWRRVNEEGVRILQFGPRGGRPLAALRCDAELESLLIERMTAAPEAGVDTMKIKAGGETDRLPIMWDGASLPVAGASIRLEDQLTDRLSRLSEPIVIEIQGEPTLSLPPDRRIGTLIEECRQV